MLNYKRYTIAIAKEIRLQLMKPVLCSLKDAQYRLKRKYTHNLRMHLKLYIIDESRITR